MEISDATQSGLNDLGVNCLRSLPGRGIRVWGARTLSSRPGWRYVNVRRLFLTLIRWLEITMADLVLEPNTESLWAKIRQRVRSYCTELMKRGALAGHDPSEAYFVKCDAETNPPELRDQGVLVSEIGLATVVPAEFLYVRVTQSANGTVATPILR
jgi:phage tail sheath protein FI